MSVYLYPLRFTAFWSWKRVVYLPKRSRHSVFDPFLWLFWPLKQVLIRQILHDKISVKIPRARTREWWWLKIFFSLLSFTLLFFSLWDFCPRNRGFFPGNGGFCPGNSTKYLHRWMLYPNSVIRLRFLLVLVLSRLQWLRWRHIYHP